MIWAFVDYENVGSLESLDLEKYQRLIIFCGPRHRKLNLGEIPTTSFCHLELIRMASTGNNNLDFHLAFYLGLHHLKAGKGVTFEVISNDKGFDGVIAHLTEMGRGCSRVNSVKKKVAKKAAKKEVVKKTVKLEDAENQTQLVNRKSLAKIREEVKEMLELAGPKNRPINQDKLLNWIEHKVSGESVSPIQVFDSLKGVGCVDATADVLKYYFGDVEKQQVGRQRKYTPEDVSEMLKLCPGRSRPRRQDKLVNWISDRLGDEEIFSLDIYEDLLEAGSVVESNGAVSYNFK